VLTCTDGFVLFPCSGMTSHEHAVSDHIDIVMSSVRFIQDAAYHIDIDNQ